MSTDISNAPPPESGEHDPWADALNRDVNVYEPHKVGLPPLGDYLRELWGRREFAFELSRTRLRAQNYGTVFGMTWLVLSPLMLGLVYFLLVSIIRGGERPEGFLAHLLGCIFAYYLFSDAVRPASRSVVGGGRLINNTAFPRSLLPLAAVGTSFMRFLPTLPVLAIILLATSRPIDLDILWGIPILVEIILLTAGVALFFAALQVYFRDLANFLPYLMRMWLYTSPILWTISQIPDQHQWLVYLNPLAPMLAAWSDAVTAGGTPHAAWLLGGLAWGVVAFVAGGLFFISREREFAVRL
jgi:ABC-type polysaccharide/polyol phosphate export permease